MIFYYLLPIITIFASYIREFRKNYFFKFFLLTGIIFFLCFGYMTGSDWRQYEKSYNSLNTRSSQSWEPGYLLLTKVFFYSGVSFWFFLIIVKIFCFASVINLFNSLSPQFWLVLSLFLAFDANFLFIDNPLRNLIAYGFIWSFFSLLFSEKNNMKKTLMFFLLLAGIAFHLSTLMAIFLVIIGMLLKKQGNKFKVVLVLLFCLIISNFSVLKEILIYFTSLLNLKRHLYNLEHSSSFFTQGKLFSFGALLRFLVYFSYAYFYGKLRKKFQNAEWEFVFLSLYIVTFYMGLRMPILGRMTYFFSPFFFVGIIQLQSLLNKNSKHFFIFILLLLSMILVHKQITNSYKYVPYTNVFILNLKGDNFGYAYRSKYNLLYSPYK